MIVQQCHAMHGPCKASLLGWEVCPVQMGGLHAWSSLQAGAAVKLLSPTSWPESRDQDLLPQSMNSSRPICGIAAQTLLHLHAEAPPNSFSVRAWS